MTILTVSHFGTFANFKHYYLYYIKVHLHEEFPDAVSYNRLVEKARCSSTMSFLRLYAFGRCTGISFVDSTMILVCYNLRWYANKVFKGYATDGKGTWNGVMVSNCISHVTTVEKSLTFCLTMANVDDRNPEVWNVLAKKLYGRLFVDRGYIAKTLCLAFQ